MVTRSRKVASAAADARKRLESDPDDSASHLVLGRYLCFSRGEWPAGLRHLARSADPALKGLARRELSAPKDGAAMAALADAWWAAAQSGPKADAERFRARATDWYRRALPELEGIHKTMAEKRIALAGPAVVPAVYKFANAAALDDFDLHGDVRIAPGGGLEMVKGDPRSFAISRKRYAYPIRLEIDVMCKADGPIDIFPSLFTEADMGGLWFAWGRDHGTATAVQVFDAVNTVGHIPIQPDRVYRILMSVDSNRKFTVEVDGRNVFKTQLPLELKLEGPICLSGGIGHVIYKRVTIEAPLAAIPSPER